MYDLFNLSFGVQTPFFRHPDWSYVAPTIRRTLDQFITYYQNQSFPVKANHVLVKLIQSIGAIERMGDSAYYDYVGYRSTNLSMALKFTSYISKGDVFNHLFFDENTSEVILSFNNAFNIKEAMADWKNVKAIEILRHSKNSLALFPLDGKSKGSNDDIAIYAINIPLLLVQYRAFRINQHLENAGDSEESIMQFVGQYVLPNMQYSFLDWAIFNRLSNLYFNKPSEPFIVKTPFNQINYEDKVDKILLDQIARFKNTKLRFDAILNMVPMISAQNLFDLAKLPNILPTRQVIWAEVLSRLPVLRFLFHVSCDSNTVENQAFMNKVLRQAIYYRSDNTLKYALPISIFNDVTDTIDELEAIGYGR